MERFVLVATAAAALLQPASSKLADRSRIVKARGGRYQDNGRPIEGPKYRNTRWSDGKESLIQRQKDERTQRSMLMESMDVDMSGGQVGIENRELGQYTGCCSNYKKYYADDLCAYYGENCDEGGGSGDHNSGDADCSMEGLSFIGISFSVNTANGNPNSYQLCDQFPMENIIDRNYNYVMSMDEDGWLVGGGYKTFDYSGKMPYIDSSHTELIRVGSMDPNRG